GQFRFETDNCSGWSSNQAKIISDSNKLHNALVFAYSPHSCDGRLCLNQAGNFHQLNKMPLHAMMNGNVSSVKCTSVSDLLIKLGGMQLLYPLFSRLNWPIEKFVAFENKSDLLEILSLHPSFANLQPLTPEMPTILVRFIFGLVQTSSTLKNQFVATKGLLIIADALNQSETNYLTKSLLDEIVNFTLYLLKEIKSTHDKLDIHNYSTSNVNIHIILIKQMYGYFLSNSELWCKATLDVQEQLYQFLATDFMEAVISGYIDRTGSIIHCLNTLKYYLALTNPRARSGYELCTPNHEIIGSVEELVKLRTNLLIYLKRLFTRGGINDNEMQLILAFLTTVQEPENIHDVLYLLVSTLIEFPNTCGQVFVRTNGIHCVFKLLTSDDEHVRIYAIKLFGLYLVYGKTSVYGNSIECFALYSLLEERLNSTSTRFSLLTYNALFEVMTECIAPKIRINSIIIIDKTMSTIKNPALLQVIAHLIAQSEQTAEIFAIKDTFIQHLFVFCTQNPYNKKTILQLSIWQNWLLHLVPLYPNNKINANFLLKILRLIRILLIYGICHELGSWQVLVDTLALIHLHICEERLTYMKEKHQAVKLKSTTDKNHSNPAHSNTSVLFSNKDPTALNNSLGVDLTECGSCQVKTDQLSSNDSLVENYSGNNSDSNQNKTNDNYKTISSCSSSVCNSDHIFDQTPDSVLSYENIELSSVSLSKPSPGHNHHHSHHQEINDNVKSKVTTGTDNFKKDKSAKFQLPNFSWSYVHHLLLDDLLCSLENIVIQRNVHDQQFPLLTPSSLTPQPSGSRDNILKQHTKPGKQSAHSQSSVHNKLPPQTETLPLPSSSSITTITSTNPLTKMSTFVPLSNNRRSLTDDNFITVHSNDDINTIHTDNQIDMHIINSRSESVFITNLLHIISYLSDMIVGACGGLLPLLAAASSSTSEIGSLESLPGIELSDGIGYLLRLTYLTDYCILDKNIDPKLLECERNLPSGFIARQLLRLYLTTAVRNCLESRLGMLLPPSYIVQTMKQLSSGNDVVHRNGDKDKNVEINEVLFIQSDDYSHTLQSIQIVTETTQTMNDIRVDRINHYTYSNGIDVTSKEVHPKHVSLPLSIESNNQFNLIEDSVENLTRKLLNLSRFHFVVDLEFYSIHRLGFLGQPWKLPDYYTSSNDLFRISDIKQDYDGKMNHLSRSFQQLLYGVKPYFNYPKNYGDEQFQNTVIYPLKSPNIILQSSDLRRLHFLITKYGETTKSPDFLALSTVYFLSVMMVSKYRDVLDPNPIWSPYSENSEHDCHRKDDFMKSHPEVHHDSDFKQELPSSMNTFTTINNEATPCNNDINNIHSTSNRKISVPEASDRGDNATDLDHNSIVSEDYEFVDIPNRKENKLADSLDISLSSAGLLLKDLFIEFMDYFSKTLIGTHGQELMPSILPFLQRTSSVIELVMLLCSQEWQTSLQKYAGWAFIELVNEGRLVSHSIRDHLYRVAVEGGIILNQLQLANTQQHTKFEEITAHTMASLREEEQLHKNVIASTRLRDAHLANYLKSKANRLAQFIMFNWMRSSINTSSSSSLAVHPLMKDYFRLDGWEDDSRRHRRLIPNPHGTNYSSSVFYVDNTRRRSVCQNHLQRLADFLKEAGAQHARDFSINSESINTNSLQPELTLDNISVNSAVNESVDRIETTNPVTLSSFHEDTFYPGRLCTDFKATANLSVPCILVSLGVTVYGTLFISKQELYFEHDTDHPNNRSIDQRVLVYIEHIYSRWSLSEIRAVFNRSFLHRKVALEIFVASRGSVLFAFTDVTSVKLVVNALPEVGIGTRYGLPMSRSSTLASPSKIFQLSNMTQRWQRRELSNFDYLMYLNTIAGRSYNDLNQYPIFPWVISNYTTKELDLSSPSNYRDLSKPIGAINPKRKAFFDERYQNWEDDSQPPFHYGTHYSTAAFVLNYLLRVEPFTSVFLNLQGGKFDHPDRIFFSVAKTWENCQINTSDVKELIPEFFYFPEMFENLNDLHLGTTNDDISVDSVILPPWAKSPEEFVRINREALESELVSCQLHHWIDLIFGYKQRGLEAVHSTNVFHYLTYEGSVDWDKITDPLLMKAVEDQIQSFGQTPGQLLTKPHPRRNSALHHNPEIFNLLNEEFCMRLKFQSYSPVVYASSNTSLKAFPFPSVIAITENRTVVVCRWNGSAADTVYRKDQSVSSPRVKENMPTKYGTDHHVLGLPLKSEIVSTLGRCLGHDFDENLRITSNQFVVTADSRAVVLCGYYDKSFRIYGSSNGRLIQAVFGHSDIVTCLARSECHLSQYHYLASGSRDCTVMLWMFSIQRSCVVNSQGLPNPLFILNGHETSINCISLSAELGLVLSGSMNGTCLLHSTRGELLRCLPLPCTRILSDQPSTSSAQVQCDLTPLQPNFLTYHREGYLLGQFNQSQLLIYTLNGKLLNTTDLSILSNNTDASYQINAILFSDCGRYILIAGNDGVIWILRSYNLLPVHAFPKCDTSIESICLSHDQRFIFAGLKSGSLVVFYVDFNQWHHEFQQRYF
ncbi:Neurobeachin, partial [Schistosoma japonicum]